MQMSWYGAVHKWRHHFWGHRDPPPTGYHLSLFCYSRWSWSGSLYCCVQFRSKSGKKTLSLSSNSKVTATGPSSHFHTRGKYRAAWTAKKERLQENISDVSSKILAIFWCKYVTKRKNPATLAANNNVRGELFWHCNAMLHLQISRLSATLVQQLAKCENCKGGETGQVPIQPVLQDLAADKCLCSPVNHTLITANCYSERT